MTLANLTSPMNPEFLNFPVSPMHACLAAALEPAPRGPAAGGAPPGRL